MKIFFSLLFLGGIVFACNPVRRIDMKNKTLDTVEFIWSLNEDSLMNNPFLLSNSKELKFTLYPEKVDAIKMSFGAGGWKPKDVEKLVGYLESLEIRSAKQKMKFDSLPQLREFLLARRKGIGGATIEIVVAD